MSGQQTYMSVFGANFTPSTTVTLVGIGVVPASLIDNGSLVVTLPPNLPPGQYVIQISDPAAGSADAPNALTVLAAPTPVPAITVVRSEPAQVTSGQGGALSIFGANFTAATTVRLVGVGLLQASFVNSGALIATLPNNLAPGGYGIEVSDPVAGTAYSPNPLTVLPAPTPPPTAMPTPEPMPTPVPPTPMPGQPSLLVRNFSSSPASIAPGGAVTLRFEVVNQGNRVAQGVSVSVDAGGKFVPANGQASAILPDIGTGGSASVSLAVIAAMDATPGPTSVPITMSYHDFSGQVYTGQATLSVTVQETSEASQVTLARYAIEPNPVEPGQAVTVAVELTNTGNRTASQVLLRVAGTDGVLLAGSQGDSFPVGDLAPGASVSLELPLIVSTAAKPGPQAQPFTLSYLQNGEAQQGGGSMTIEVKRAITPSPLLLIDSYDTGKEVLEPGEQFTLTMNLQNVGDADATELLVAFGTVESSGTPPGGDSGNTGGTGSGSGSTSTTTPSNVFAPLGSGGTRYVGTIEANGGSATLSQEFIVNGTVDSGVYSLPITLRYKKTDGAFAQDNLRASVVVVAPPRLHISLQSPIPETVNMGEPFAVALTVLNTGDDPLHLTTAAVAAENAEVLEGAEVFVGPVKKDEDATLGAVIMPSAEGPVTVTVTLYYLNDLNQEQSIVNTYQTQALSPPPPPEDTGPTPEVTPPAEEEEEDDSIGRLILGFLGLGS
jgi:hypothetical protein